MLLNLHVKNLALIEDVDVDFTKGLVVLTGETGAGKSLILGSINIALGNKFTKESIRNGKDYSLVELTFSMDEKTKKKLEEFDIDAEGDTVTVSRKITENRSVSKINGETVNVTILKSVMSSLIDIHGQHEHQSLLHKSKHMEMLDKYACNHTQPLLQQISSKYREYTKLNKELEEFGKDDAQRVRELEFAKYEVDEINDANLLENEDEILETEYKKISNGQTIIENLNNVDQIFNENQGINQLVSSCISLINDIDCKEEEFVNIKDQIYNLEALSHDIARDVYSYANQFEFDPSRIKEIEDRLDLINHLKLKYGRTINDILEYRDKQQIIVENLQNYEENLQKLNEKINQCNEELTVLCDNLTAIRRENSIKLSKLVKEALYELNFLQVEFEIEIVSKDTFNEKGKDDVEFVISTNPGEPLRPLGKVASGGELSRIMLALKSIIANEDDVDTLIFDEIDTGISGKTAKLVAEKMSIISNKQQVICISHLSQIAAMADSHYLIEKYIENNETFTNISKLSYDEQIYELVRISGGSNDSESAYNLAKEMKDMANKTKIRQS